MLVGEDDIKNRSIDEEIVENLLDYLGCKHSLRQLLKVTRLGQRKFRRNRLMMICFDNEQAAKQILERSPRLCRSETFNRIFVNKNLPSEQRQAFRRDGNTVAEAARGASERSGELPTNVYVNNNTTYEFIPNSSDSTPTSSSDSEYSDSEDSDVTIIANSDDEGWVTLSEANSDVEDDSTAFVANATALGAAAAAKQPQAVQCRATNTAVTRGTPSPIGMDEGEVARQEGDGVAVGDALGRQVTENMTAIQEAISSFRNEGAMIAAHEAVNSQGRGGGSGG